MTFELNHSPWKKDFPYQPSVSVSIAQTGANLLLHYRVREEEVRAVAAADNGRVWEDSCCEFFCKFDDTGYYNIECNAAGTLLMGWGPQREGRELAPSEVLATVSRQSSLGRTPFEAQPAPDVWELQLSIPVTAFWHHRLTTFRGLRLSANIYKCGDQLTRPHFLTLFPIPIDHPDFHRPDFFQEIILE